MYKLLIVDDEYETCNGLCNYFPWEEIGFEVAGNAQNGKQALAFLETHSVDIILSDIRMPIMDGIELAQVLYENKKDIILVFLSAHRDFDYARLGIRYGVQDYILKPTKYEEIKKTFSRIKDKLDFTKEKDRKPAQEETFQSIIQVVKRYIEENPRTASLEGAAALVNMNSQYLSKLFKRKNTESFSDYVMSVKMAQAKKLLGNPCYRIGEISEMLGYTNGKNFNRAFQAYYDMSPKKFRDLLESKGEADEDRNISE